MFQTKNPSGDLATKYNLLAKQLDALLEGELDNVSNLSNASALLNQFLENINWCGFYLVKNNELLLGPFQGLPACVHIPLGKGVCGTVAQSKQTLIVEDVHAFPGHIACDSASQSEIVVPIIVDNVLYGVLDIDSPIKGRFSKDDQAGLEQFVSVLTDHLYL
ncbi:GAF domain-containing protein [Rummeliibacillus suwonensis]|jgi:GAF domain-containing protein|uniref:GAF domain-containing protein n=1 Tax=Rummeliibacillus suwonensis TaxID=1306154 RepID=UPI0011B7B8E5|nr:GAF domain-containing protein [Rummeliibacillus suwonensis]MBO2536939.1 GAF domain-containing protein [Rummeliibacillus suwonensis]